MSVTANWISRQTALRLTVTPLARGRVSLQESLTNVCSSYSKQMRKRLVTAEDYPITWCTWPLMTLGMLKSPAFRDEPIADIDERSNIFAYIITASPSITDLLFRPSVYPLQDLIHDGSLGLWTKQNQVTLPAEVGGSMEYIQNDGLYLLDDSNFLIL